ncbi:MAG: acylglycerol kinase family protein [Nanoarchaeota archaeon]|nr:acylglycerol kinase family protein [Nanoarchaeota archaeon]
MRKIYLVSNNYSTKNKLIRWREISSLLEKKDESIILSKENVEKLTSVIDSEDFLCINGGDGTIQKVLDYFLKQEKKLPIIVPLNAGATNALARDTNIFGSPYSILKKIVYLRNEQFLIQTRYLMKITDYNSQKICYGFFAGFGIMPYLFKNRHGDFLTGRKTHLKVSKTIFSALQKKRCFLYKQKYDFEL